MSPRNHTLRRQLGRPQSRRFRPLACEPLEPRAMLAANFSQFLDPHPAAGNQFGHAMLPLSTGNVVITSPYDDYGGTDAGAVYLFNGATGALISTLRGSHSGDNIGLQGVTVVGNGNFVVLSQFWDNGDAANAGAATWGSGTEGVKGVVSAANSLVGDIANDGAVTFVTPLTKGNYVVSNPYWSGSMGDAGAVTWGSGATGVKGVISAANSLVGTLGLNYVGIRGVTPLSNGNYVVESPLWDSGPADNNVGAATWGSGTTGIKGAVSAANSLVGSTFGDQVSFFGLTALTNGNYVVHTVQWDNGAATDAGAMTWGSGTAGVKGVISAANSLVGSTTDDQIGSDGVTLLTNGNYVVRSPLWDNAAATDAGAVTWGSGAAGVKGVVSAANSLVGSTSNDWVGFYGVTALTNGNYVVSSGIWDNGVVTNAGAATWGSGTTGVKGVVSAANSLVGSTAEDQVAISGVTALTNGNYVVRSHLWDNGATANVGAVTWGNGTTGVKDEINSANSLVGSFDEDEVGVGGVTALANGNYVVSSLLWDNGGATDAGASTWGSGTAGIQGPVSADNSLVGSTQDDKIGSGGVTVLPNGNYIVSSLLWDNGAATDAGAVTWGSGTAGVKGAISDANSLVGSTAEDQVGLYGVTVLSNGNYVVISANWDNGAITQAGAATFGSGTAGVHGIITAANSLVGTTSTDFVGSSGVTALSNGNYVVKSPSWINGAAAEVGAATWGSGTTGVQGAISAANSLIGSTTNDLVSLSGVTALPNGNYVVASRRWNGGTAVNAGAVTWGGGATGINGVVSSQNSALGAAANTDLQPIVIDNVNDTFYARFLGEGGGTIRVGSQQNGFQPAPVIANFGGATSYTENGGAVSITSTATISDVDSPNFAQGELRIALKTNGTADDRLRIRTQGTGSGQINVQGSQVRTGTIVLGTFSGGVGTAPLVIKLTDQATEFRVQQLLRNVVFYNVSDNPATAVRTLRATLSDSDGFTSAPAFKKINVVAVNDAPKLGLGGSIGYVHDSPAITLAAGALVSDVDSPNFFSGRLRVRITDGASTSNRLAIGAGFTVDANNNVLQGTTIIGERVANGFGTNELIITFNTKATPAIVQQLVRAITFKTVGGAAGQRKVLFSVSDGDGGLSAEASKTVNVT